MVKNAYNQTQTWQVKGFIARITQDCKKNLKRLTFVIVYI